MITHKIITSLGLGIALALSACNAKVEAPSFDDALSAHLQAVADRDVEAYAATLTTGKDLPMIFPGGYTLNTVDEVVDFHTTWFTDDQWIMEPEAAKTYVRDTFAIATTRYAFRDTPEGEPRHAILTMVFELQNNEWRLVHDQNTRITPIE